MIAKPQKLRYLLIAALFLAWPVVKIAYSQAPRSAAVERGSETAKGGFNNENEIRDKLNRWQTDEDARAWLSAMNYDIGEIVSVTAAKPHGEKSDVVVNIKTAKGEHREGISIKLVSSPNGFNQVDKRWLRQYAAMWDMPPDVVKALRLFVGEDPPTGKSRRPERMFLTELDKETQTKVVEFFSINKEKFISEILGGSGPIRATRFMVALRSGTATRWTIRTIDEAISFYSEGPVEITRAGSLKIGRVTMQRKGGDGGRETAKQLQFKINPGLIFH